MKLCFTTLGCMEWTLDQIVTHARNDGYAGVDFRGFKGEINLWKLREFRADVATTRRRFADAGLALPCLGSSARMVNPGTDGSAALEEVKHYAEIAHNLGADYIRVFGGALGGTSFESALPAAEEFLNEAAAIARGAGIEVLVETHDDWVNTEWLMTAFDAAKFPVGVGILWDVHHPYRQAGEKPEDTWKRIGALTRYTHWKDSVMLEVPGPEGIMKKQLSHKLPGEGDLPLARFYEILVEAGYTGWYTLEWERKWHPELAAPEVAFPIFVQVMRQIEAKKNR